MNWHRWLTALFVMLALAGCAEAVTGQGQAPYPAHPLETERGGGDGGGGSM
jgi:hypothetical protein